MATTIQAGNGLDPSVVIPDAIRAGASRADQLIAAEQAKARGEAPPEPVQPQPEGKDAQPPAPLQQQTQPSQSEPPLQAEPAPQPTPQPTPQPAPPQVTPEQWEQRYRAMKGRYDALAASSQQAQQEFQRQIDELRDSMQRQPAQPAPAMATFDEEDDATWGPDFRNAVQRRIDAAVAQVRQEISGKVKQVENTLHSGSEGALRQQLDQLMPEWNDINNDPQFHAWLALPDEMSGVKRHLLVNKAYDERNAQRVLKFFKSFLSEAAPAPAGSQQPAPLPAPNGTQPPASQRLSLADLAAPGAARPAAASPPAAPVAKRFWTNSEIGAFYQAKHKGLYDTTPENKAMAAAYEADIYAAQAEGRVRPG